jgi:hypothetical protein
MSNEADRSRRFVVPKLQAAGWKNEPHSIAGQLVLSDCMDALRGKTPYCGNVNKNIGRFDGADQLRNAVNQLQSLLYSAWFADLFTLQLTQ